MLRIIIKVYYPLHEFPRVEKISDTNTNHELNAVKRLDSRSEKDGL